MNKDMGILSPIHLFVIAVFVVGCKDAPPPVVPIPPSHPTITWVADTIRNPYQGAQLLLKSIWGSDTNNVYAAGHNEVGGRASLYHYDGNKWSPVKITRGEGGFINSYVGFSKIEGSGKNDVWAVGYRGGYYGISGDSSLVLHFNGSTWTEVAMERCKDGIQGIKVVAPMDVYFSGSHGEIIHYDGTSFTKTVLDTNLSLQIGGDAQRMFVGGRALGLSLNNYYCVYSKERSGAWSLITKTTEIEYYKKKNYGLYVFYPWSGGRYFAGGEGIYAITDTTWQTSYDKETIPFLFMDGTSSSNIFAVSPYSRIMHWNGVDWKAVNTPDGVEQNKYLWDLWVKGSSIYVIYRYSYDTNIIYRGTYSR